MYSGYAVIGIAAAAIAFLIDTLLKPQSVVPPVLIGLGIYILLARLWWRLGRRRIQARVTVARTIAAPPDQVWSLLSSAEAWALRPGGYAFGVTPTKGGPLRVLLLVRASGHFSCTPYALTELPATVDQPARSLVMRTPGMSAAQGVTQTILVAPDGSGARVVITHQHGVRRSSVLAERTAWRAEYESWLDACTAVLTGHRDPPGKAVPPDVLYALAAPLPAGDVVELSASTLIATDPALAWSTIWDPATALALPGNSIIAAGFVPGSPIGQPGEIQYFIGRSERQQGRLHVSLHYTRTIEAGRMALGRVTGGSFNLEERHLIEPTAGGTRFTLTYRFAGPRREIRERMQAALDQEVARYKALIEETGTRALSPER